MCIYSPMPHTLSYCALIGKCALIYIFIKSPINLCRNAVRFENSSGNWLSDGLNSARYGMYAS